MGRPSGLRQKGLKEPWGIAATALTENRQVGFD